jgi:hypothetical protein
MHASKRWRKRLFRRASSQNLADVKMNEFLQRLKQRKLVQ